MSDQKSILRHAIKGRVGTLAAIALAFWTLNSREVPLLDRATRIKRCSNFLWYDWVSNSELISSKDNYDDLWVYKINSRNKGFRSSNVKLWIPDKYGVSPLALSPDRQFLTTEGYEGRVPIWAFLDLKSHTVSCLDRDFASRIFLQELWLQDDQRWVTLLGPEITSYEIATKKQTFYQIPLNLNVVHLLGSLSRDRLLVADVEFDEPNSAIILYSVDLRLSKASVLDTITLPFQARVEGAVLSPDTNSIAWLFKLDVKPLSPMESFLSQVLHFHKSDTPTLSLWVSNLQGKNMHEIDCLRAKDFSHDLDESGIRWLPDGKSISFIYKNDLYKVSIT